MKMFGWSFDKPRNSDKHGTPTPTITGTRMSPVPPENTEGSLNVSYGAGGGSYGYYLDLDGIVVDEFSLINRYRDMQLIAEVDEAIDEIINEIVIQDRERMPISLNLDYVRTFNDATKTRIQAEFDSILKQMHFHKDAYSIVRQWYIDGRLYYYLIVDSNDTKKGIQELRLIDPRTIKRVREVVKKRHESTSTDIVEIVDEYWVYNPMGWASPNNAQGQNPISSSAFAFQANGTKIPLESIASCPSGLYDTTHRTILSWLHKAIKPLNILRMIEDACVIYRVSRAPERRVFYVDIGNLPKQKAEQYLNDIMLKHKNKMVYDIASGDIRDDRKFMCLDMNTEIPLLDGRTLSIAQIATELSLGKKLWAYSADPHTGAFVPGLISWAGVTQPSATVVKVTFDNGESVVCTPNHKFPVWNKGFVEAKNLSVGESMIPLYRRQEKMNGGNEYEQFFDNTTKEWVFTHRSVAEWNTAHNTELPWNGVITANEHKNTVHHRNFKRHDNTPENLIWMSNRDHFKYHSSIVKEWIGPSQTIQYPVSLTQRVSELLSLGLTKNQIIETVNNDASLIKEFHAVNSLQKIRNKESFILTHKDLNRIAKMSLYASWVDMRKNINPSKRTIKRQNASSRGSIEHITKLKGAFIHRKPHCKTWAIVTPEKERIIIQNLTEFCNVRNLNRNNIKGKFGSRKYFAEPLCNHKIVSIEHLQEKIAVGTLTIDQDEQYHNYHTFALAAGVYTKNSMMEDYWLPRRDGAKSTEISTLPGGQNLSEMDDVEYFRRKLYRALNVPPSRIDSATGFQIGKSSEITRDELKFSKFIHRLQVQFNCIFDQILERQLRLKNILTEQEWHMIKDDVRYVWQQDSFFEEAKKQEMWTERMNLLAIADQYQGKYFSSPWIRKEVLHLTDDEWTGILTDMDHEEIPIISDIPIDSPAFDTKTDSIISQLGEQKYLTEAKKKE